MRTAVILAILLFFCQTGQGNYEPLFYYPELPDPSVVLQPPPPTEFVNEHYDIIVVGAGSAGAVIANRLSEIKQWNVLLLEAGETESYLAKVPAMAGALQLTKFNWAYVTEPQTHACLGMVERRCASARGKVLGGTSGINSMIYTRANPEDYNRWAAQGNPGWSYPEVLPYFLKSEDARLNESNEEYHNIGGYLSVEDPYISRFGKAFLEAGEQLGYKITDHNSPEQYGFSRLQANMKRGRRHSTATAFLDPLVDRQNLKILSDVMVTKLLIDDLTNRVYAVEYNWRNKRYVVRATKEVILSAGVYGSPQLLMLSGVGPKYHLQELGIRTLYDLPVGEALYNHFAFAALVINTNLTNTRTGSMYFDPQEILEWYINGVGPLASAAGSEAVAFINTGISHTGKFPDVELAVQGGSYRTTSNNSIQRQILRFSDEYYQRMFASSSNENFTFSITPILLHPKSKGFIKLQSANPYDYPLIYANYLTDAEDHDIRTLVAGIRVVQKLLKMSAFKQYNATIDPKRYIGCEHLKYDSDAYWECAIRIVGHPINHQTTTCRMGPVNDPTSVVNHELKVHGLRNLRVADTSVIPFSLSAHTHAPAVMIGEKASDLIKKEWGVLPDINKIDK